MCSPLANGFIPRSWLRLPSTRPFRSGMAEWLESGLTWGSSLQAACPPQGATHRHLPQGGELGVLPGQGAAHGPQGAGQVGAERPEDDGEVSPLPVQGVQEAEEGGQDQVVALAGLPLDREDVVWPARPLQQLQVASVEATETPARARLGEGGVPAVAAVVAEGTGAGWPQGGAVARPLPLACKKGGRSAAGRRRRRPPGPRRPGAHRRRRRGPR